MNQPRHILLYFLFFWLLTQLFYWPTWNAGFVTDFTGLLERLEGSPASGILVSFGFPAQQQFLNLFLYLFYHLFGVDPLGWYLVQTTLHALNAFLLFHFLLLFLQLLKVPSLHFAAMVAAVLFLLCPYQSEVVVWRVCFNYLISTALILVGLNLLIRWLTENQKKYLYFTLGCYTLALFTFEYAFTFPFLSGLVLLTFYLEDGNKQQWTNRALWLLGPQVVLGAGYFVLNRLTLGVWVGHYGADTHFNLNPLTLAGTAFQYFAKLFGAVRYYSFDLKKGIFESAGNPVIVIAGLLALLFLAYRAVRHFRRFRPEEKAATALLFLFFAGILPVLNLYFNYNLLVENDRYSYLASGFLFAAVAVLFGKLPAFWRNSVLLLYIAINAYLLGITNWYWRESTLVYRSLLEQFEWQEAENVYLLNLPDNYRGIMMFRDYGEDAQTFLDALRYIENRPFRGKLHEVAAYNMRRVENGVEVAAPAPDTLRITFDHWGSWWWRDGFGATDYETEQYRFLNEGHHYQLIWKERPEKDAVILFQDGPKWKVYEGDAAGVPR